ncbi:MAG TPA: hypothetical protein ENJ82_07050 [Bacteroidetes bacterium]|nr:hypothetical protein [Bacteroidota bacterium]
MTRVLNYFCGFFSILWMGLLPGSILAQDTPYIQFDVEDGLPSNYVYRVIQDRQGYIWMATDAGVTRFDGQHFELFTIEDGLRNNDILNIQEDSQGRIWFMTLSGGFCYYKDGVIYNSDNDPHLKGGPKKSFLAFFFEDSSQRLWFYSRREGIYCLDADTLLQYDTPGSLPGFGVGGIWEGTDQQIYVRVRHQIWSLSPALMLVRDSLEPFAHISGHFPLEMGKGILIGDYEGNIWVEKAHEQRLFVKLKENSRAIFIRFLRDGHYWVSTLSGGIERLKEPVAGRVFRRGDTYFPKEVITSVMQDNEGNTWFSSEKSGVFLVRPYQIKNYTHFKGLETSGVQVMFEDKDGQKWLCMDSERLAKSSALTDTFVASQHRAGFRFNGVMALPQGGVFSFGAGLTIVPNGDPSVVYFPLSMNVSPHYNYWERKNGFVFVPNLGAIKKMVLGQDGLFWGASNESFFRFDPLKNPGKAVEILEKGRFSAVTEGEDGTIWLGRSDGLYAYRNGVLESHRDVHLAFLGAPEDLAYSKSTGLWVATNGQGLINYDPKSGQTWQFTTEDHLAGNLCQHLALVDDRELWVSTQSGLSRLDFTESFRRFPFGSIHTLTKEEGLLSNEITSIYVQKDSIFACTPRGISAFVSSEANRRLPSPPVHLNQISFGDSIYGPETSASMPYSNNSPTFSFVALSFGSLGKVRYEYRIRPLESSFNTTLVDKTTYNKLPPGNYTFELRAITKDGIRSNGIVQYDFSIRKAWWQTWFFRIFLALVLSFLIWAGFMLRYRNRSRRIELERKFLESERKALRAQMNPHFIFNSLNSIQNFLAQNDRKAAYTYLARFGKLIRSILENSDKTYITVEEELTVLNLYLQMESLRADNQFAYEIVVDPKIHLGQVLIPPMLLQPYVENAIWHGVLPRKTGGHIYIELKLEGEEVWCRIEDNGVGRKVAAKSGTKDKQKRSFGTRITEERLSLLNGNRRRKISVKTADLTDEKGHALGTRVELFLPFMRND